MRSLAWIVVILLAAEINARAADSDLKPLADALTHVRAIKPVNTERDAGPELNDVKTALRKWAESRFERFNPFVLVGHGEYVSASGIGALADQLNTELRRADLTCDSRNENIPRCGNTAPDGYGERESSRGYVGGESLRFLDYSRYLLLETSVGIVCGYDESAYVYEWRKTHWQRIFTSETDDYRDRHYTPENFISVEVSPANIAWNERPPKPPLIMTLGDSPWCASNWNVLYARLWRVSSVTTTPKPLFDLSPTLFTGNAPQIAIGSVTDHDALIQYQGDAIGAGVRPHVLHFLVKDNDRIERAAPVALNPADFVDEWLTRPWSESAQWTDFAGNAGALAKEHKARHLPYISGDVDGKAMRCKHDPTLWQVWFRPSDDKFRPGEPAYFLVRWMPPYRFTLVAIRTRSDPSCNIEESMPDAFGTLFPLQDWRR